MPKKPAHRPNKTHGIKRVNLNCRVNPDTKEQGKAYAVTLGISLGELIDLLIRNYERTHNERNTER